MTQVTLNRVVAARRVCSSVLLTALIAGCGGPASVPTLGPTAQPQRTLPPTVRQLPPPATSQVPATGQTTAAVALTAQHLPFAAGRGWTYQVSSQQGDKTETGTVAWTVDESGPDRTKVTITSNMNGQQHVVSNLVVKNPDGTVTITNTTDGQTQSQTVKPEEAAGAAPTGPGAGDPAAAMPKGVRDSVTVPAGTFEAIKVVTAIPDNKGSISAWYVDGIGLVKQEIQAQTEQGAMSSTMALTAHRQ